MSRFNLFFNLRNGFFAKEGSGSGFEGSGTPDFDAAESVCIAGPEEVARSGSGFEADESGAAGAELAAGSVADDGAFAGKDGAPGVVGVPSDESEVDGSS